MLHPTVFNTSEVCAAYGVSHAVFSPGSRNAPLTISFARNDKIKKWIIPDERSAGFIALGIAQKLQEPVVLCCTSGTALLNYAPAIAEAFYREIPLIVLSADRPLELIDQRDGQTIRQFEALKNHVKASIQLPTLASEDDGDSYTQKLTTGLKTAQELPKGPVHFNVPFREPFYPSTEQKLNFYPVPKWHSEVPSFSSIQFPQLDLSGKKVLVIVGQSNSDKSLNESIQAIQTKIPILVSPLSNLGKLDIEHVDLFLNNQPELKPDILITSGLSVLSKKLKSFIRKHKPEAHFHLDPSGVEVDTYGTTPQIINAPLNQFLDRLDLSSISKEYKDQWKRLSEETSKLVEDFVPSLEFSEVVTFHKVLKSLPESIELHLGNSMPVRFAEIFGVKQGITNWSNRGTSGIDGTTSTALGTSLVSKKINLLLTGDLAFLYDRNAFFHNSESPNLRVIVFNNQGGGIFRLIDGPKDLPELEEYFETRHNRTAEYICLENKIEYTQARSFQDLASGLEHFFEDSQHAKLLEVFTDPATNEKAFKALKNYINEHIND